MKRNFSEILETSSENGDIYDSSSTAKKKKKMVEISKKSEDNINSSLVLMDEYGTNVFVKKENLNDFVNEENLNSFVKEENPNGFAKEENPDGFVKDLWSKESIVQLLNRIKETIPAEDNLKYTSRLSRLDWNSISFDDYNAKECENMWTLIQKKSRCYRLLKEIVIDAEAMLLSRSESFYNSFKTLKHPEKPSKPLSSFMLFYLDTKGKIQKEHPGINGVEVAKLVGQLWRKLKPKKLEKYKTKAQELRKEYEQKMAEFYQNYPEYIQDKNEKSKKKRSKRNKTVLGFEKPKSAFQLYFQSYYESLDDDEKNCTAKEIIEKSKLKWKSLPECVKVTWIESAQKEEEIYHENLKKYESEHPGFVLPAVKTVITKNERHVLENCSGKPKKPPSNAYSLFSTLMLQSDLLKTMPPRERLSEISKRWKSMEESERKAYAKKLQKLESKYKKKYDKYLTSLSPQQRLEEEVKKSKAKKRKPEVNFVFKPEISEPEKPPTNVVEFFRLKHENEWKKNPKNNVAEIAKKKWEKLQPSQKKAYVEELKQLNDEYMLNFSKFIQNCPPEKVIDYLGIITKHKQELERDS